MNTLVSFELAKLLKEKGFDVRTKKAFYPDGRECNYYPYDNLGENDSYFWRPTITEVVMWMYEKQGIWIAIECDVYGKEWYPKLFVASEELWADLDRRNKVVSASQKLLNVNTTPRGAFEAAIEYTLNNLI